MNTSGAPVSAAVPHLDIDPFSMAFFADPYPAHEAMREAGPVVYLDKWNIYGVARYAQVHEMLNDPATFCSSRGVGLSDFKKEQPWRPPSLILEVDPPAHGRTRAVLSQVLSPTVLKGLRERFVAAAEARVDALLEKRRFDAIEELAEAYPLSIFPDALGLRPGGASTFCLTQASCSTRSDRRTSCVRRRSIAQCRIRRISPSNASAKISPQAELAPASTPMLTKAKSPRLKRRFWSAPCSPRVSTPRSTALARLSIAWRAFRTSGGRCAAT
jgi:cytochrome P450